MARKGTAGYERQLLLKKIERAADRGYYFDDIDLYSLDAEDLRGIREDFYAHTIRINPETGEILHGDVARKIEQREHFNRTIGKTKGINLETASLAENDEVDDDDLYRTNYMDTEQEPLPDEPYEEEPDFEPEPDTDDMYNPDYDDEDDDEYFDASGQVIDDFKNYLDDALQGFDEKEIQEIHNLIDYAMDNGDPDELATRIQDNWDEITEQAHEYLKYKNSKQRNVRAISERAYYQMYHLLTGNYPTSAQALNISSQY